MKRSSLMAGISVPVLTPYHADKSINYEEYERLIRHLVAEGVDGIFVCGTSGEFINMTMEERKNMLIHARRVCGTDVSVMFHVTAMNLKDLQELSDWALQEGADAVSVTAPYYHQYDTDSLVRYFQTVSEMNKDLPVYLYNIPAFTRNPITPELLKEVVTSCSNVKGIKDSSMDLMTLLEYQATIDSHTFEIITGNDGQVLSALQAGGCGGLVVMANLFPRLFVNIYNDFHAGKIEEAKAAQTRLLKFRKLCREIMPIVSHKQVLELEGFAMGPSRFPFRDLTVGEKEKIEIMVEKLQLIV